MKEINEKSIHVVHGSISSQPFRATDSRISLCTLSQMRDEIIKANHTFPVIPLSHSVLIVFNIIWQRLFEPGLNVKVLKEECQIHDNNISSTFKREMGQSIKAYIEWKRLEVAIALLENSNYSVTDISYAVGYEHIETFYRAFIRHLHCSPGVYRSRNRPQQVVADFYTPGRKAVG